MMLLDGTMNWMGELGQFGVQSSMIAQSVNGDLRANIQVIWSNLVQTGQLWAFLIGVGLGWWLRSILP